MRQSDTYADECLVAALDGLAKLLRRVGLEPADVDLLIPSQSPLRFAHLLRKATGLGDKVVDVTREYGHVHTAGPGLALAHALREHRLGPGSRVVFLTVGAGRLHLSRRCTRSRTEGSSLQADCDGRQSWRALR